MLRATILSATLLAICFAVPAVSQQAPTDKAEAKKAYATYAKLFDAFQAKRDVLLTKMDRLREREDVKPEELKKAEDEMRALDNSYVDALETYIQGHPKAEDLMPARFELAVTLSRLDDKLEKAVTAADDFLKNHADSELVPDIRFVKAQTLFRIPGREKEALAALELFIEKYPERQDADAARMMRIRTLLFLNEVKRAKASLDALLHSEKVKHDKDAKEFLQVQYDDLAWIGQALPGFTLRDLKSNLHKSDDYKGKPTLIVVWDSNSSACLGELPFAAEAFKRFGEKMNFLSVSVNESQPALEQWLDRNKEAVKFPTVWIDRDAENTLVKKLNVTLIPFFVLLDASGKIYRYDVRSDDMLRYAAALTK